jgi:tRNA(Ile)-lysidine synthase TilS/MesJ
MNLCFNQSDRKWFLNPVATAITRYHMLKKRDQVCVALSGGKDSVTLLYILAYLARFSWLKGLRIIAAHIKTFEDYDTTVLQNYCRELDVPYFEKKLRVKDADPTGQVCYLCSRLKRGVLKEIMFSEGIRTIAYGHHADDAAVTLLMNMCEYRKIGTFVPRMDPDAENEMTIIRPLVYLTEQTISDVHRHFGLPLMKAPCKYQHRNIRQNYRVMLEEIKARTGRPDCPVHMVQAIENIDEKNRWDKLISSTDAHG